MSVATINGHDFINQPIVVIISVENLLIFELECTDVEDGVQAHPQKF